MSINVDFIITSGRLHMEKQNQDDLLETIQGIE